MSDSHSPEAIKKHVRSYLAVFAALLVGTIVTVGLYYVHFEKLWVTVTVALFVASIKGTLVACYFMHLISERRAIYSTLLVTVFFFAAVQGTVWFAAHVVGFLVGVGGIFVFRQRARGPAWEIVDS